MSVTRIPSKAVTVKRRADFLVRLGNEMGIPQQEHGSRTKGAEGSGNIATTAISCAAYVHDQKQDVDVVPILPEILGCASYHLQESARQGLEGLNIGH